MDNNSPEVVRYTQNTIDGVTQFVLNKRAIGYVVEGKKYIYDGDRCAVVNKGELYYLDCGTHSVENIPSREGVFEQIVIYYTDAILKNVIQILNISYDADIHKTLATHFNVIDKTIQCHPSELVGMLFESLCRMARADVEADDTFYTLMLTSLIYLISENRDCPIYNRIISNLNDSQDNMVQVVVDNILNDYSIKELAEMCGRSESVFKRRFQRYFQETPHRYIIKQRIMHARNLLETTNFSITEIGERCVFTTTSHFIRCFRHEFGTTPAEYRAMAKREAN